MYILYIYIYTCTVTFSIMQSFMPRLTSVAVGAHIDPLGGSAGQRVATLVALCAVTVVRTITLGTWPTLETWTEEQYM